MGNPAPISSFIPPLRDQGIDFLVGAGELGISIQICDTTLTGATTALLFANLVTAGGHSIKPPADGLYTILVGGGATTAARLDPTTRTTLGFSIIGGTNLDVVTLIFVGRLAGQAK